MKKAKQWISNLKLIPHPEGGYFSEVYRSDEVIPKECLNKRYSNTHSISTSIYFLLNVNEFSAFHKIKSDEIWHFYDGSAIEIYLISNNGNLEIKKLGLNFEKNELPQIVIPKNVWFAAAPIDKKCFSLVGCTVAPGFEFEDFELAKREDLLNKYPQHNNLILQFTR